MPGSAESRPRAANERLGAFQATAGIAAEAFQLWRPPPKIETARWIEANVVLPADVSDTTGPMELFAYQRGICDAVDDPEIDRVSWQKCARIGASTIMVGIVASFVKNNPKNILMFQPTLDDARDFCLSTVDSIFAASPNLRGLLAQDKKKHATIQQRQFPGGWFKCDNAVAGNMRRKFVHVLILDETDAYPPSPEGNILKLAENRTRTVRDRLIFQASTPTDAATSNIAQAYAESDQRIYEICCPHCGDYFEPQWKDVIWDKTEAGEHLPDTAHLVCPANGCIVLESSKADAVKAGRWRKTAPHIRNHAGFKCSALISTIEHAGWGQIAREFLEAKDDAELRKVWQNTLMGEPWIDRAGEGLDESNLMNRAEPFGFEAMPADVRVLTAGVDVQDDRLVVVSVAHSATQMFALGYEEIWGAPTSDVVWRELDDKLKRRFAHPLGGTIGYDAAAIDSGSGSHTDIVYAFCKPRLARRIWATKGVGGVRPLIERSASNTRQELKIIGVDGAKSRLFGLLEKPGHVRFSADLPTRFFNELVSERRVLHYVKGQPRKRWERIKGARAEALDGFIYAMAVRHQVGVDLTARENELRNIAQPPKFKTIHRSKWMEGHRD